MLSLNKGMGDVHPSFKKTQHFWGTGVITKKKRGSAFPIYERFGSTIPSPGGRKKEKRDPNIFLGV